MAEKSSCSFARMSRKATYLKLDTVAARARWSIAGLELTANILWQQSGAVIWIWGAIQ